MKDFSASPLEALRSMWRNRELIRAMAWREIAGRYRGSALGIGWSVVQPLLMLCVYTLVFADIFQMRWPGIADGSRIQFAVMIFSASIIQTAFAEVVSRSPTIVVTNTNLVRKVIFPLEVLPVVALVSAMIQALINVALLLLINLAFNGTWHWSALLSPFILVPFLLMTLGLSWFLAAIGAYVRDLGQGVGVALTLLLFLSPIFYPMSAVPASLRPFMMLNPLALIAEQQRKILALGDLPDFGALAIYFVVALLIACSGFACFQKVRKGFADVV
jgi:lipopolysaccharide transport system permease protein